MGFDNSDLIALFCSLVAVPVGALVTNMIVEWAWKSVEGPVDRPARHHRPITFLLGQVEILLYVLSILVGVPIFIAIWLFIKSAGRWQAVATQASGRTVWNIYMLGNGLTVLFGVIAWIVWVLLAQNPFPLRIG